MKHFVNLMPEELKIQPKNYSKFNGGVLHKLVMKYFSLVLPGSIAMNNYFHSNRLFVFSFVRHPFDRLVSGYVEFERLNVKKSSDYLFIEL